MKPEAVKYFNRLATNDDHDSFVLHAFCNGIQ